jgi:hypothetical protein
MSTDGLTAASVIQRDAAGNVSMKCTRAAIANAIGVSALASDIDLDAMMVCGDRLIFCIRPIGSARSAQL